MHRHGSSDKGDRGPRTPMGARDGAVEFPQRHDPVVPMPPRDRPPTRRDVLQLQRLAGNGAVARLLRGATSAKQAPAAGAEPVVQRHIKNKSYVDYGGTNADGLGTSMVSEFWPGWSPGVGSKPSVEPGWWPHPPDIAASFFSNYMVQGHLLNQKIGGPGNNMDNLTPITKSANTMHEKKIENAVKNNVKSGKHVVDYHVEADYSTSPAADELAPNETAAVKNRIAAKYAPKLPGKIVAEFTAWNEKPNGQWVETGDRWKIGNEGKEVT